MAHRSQAFAIVLLLCAGCGQSGPSEAPGPALASVLGGGVADRFARVTAPRAFGFPEDWGAHRNYRSEWWYFTGNVEDRDGRPFGFELTFFRFGLGVESAQRDSRWAATDVWMAHLAVTDVAGERFVAEERLEREALGLAGAELGPARVWVDDWTASGAPGSSGEIELAAKGERIDLRLAVAVEATPVAQGDRGMDRKGGEPGNASYYYSLPRVAVAGTLGIDGEAHQVHGLGWIDREWGSSELAAGTRGWDWFGLQLSDGRELMFYRLRLEGGGTSPFSSGALIGPGNERVLLAADDVVLDATRSWSSHSSGARYPVAWRLTVPSAGLRLEVEPRLENQELELAVRYWEGAVSVSGSAAGKPVTGTGYLELTGY